MRVLVSAEVHGVPWYRVIIMVIRSSTVIDFTSGAAVMFVLIEEKSGLIRHHILVDDAKINSREL